MPRKLQIRISREDKAFLDNSYPSVTDAEKIGRALTELNILKKTLAGMDKAGRLWK